MGGDDEVDCGWEKVRVSKCVPSLTNPGFLPIPVLTRRLFSGSLKKQEHRVSTTKFLFLTGLCWGERGWGNGLGRAGMEGYFSRVPRVAAGLTLITGFTHNFQKSENVS
jgi:hypothetical protein